MTYTEALEYIHSVCWKGSRPGLERISVLMDILGNPQDSLKFVHVAGTNGKGSFCSMLSSVLTESGYITGRFTSPYVLFFEERMCVDGIPISKNELAYITEQVKAAADLMEDPPTEFELITAIGFLFFKHKNCDLVVLEAGMGGRLDSTNIIRSSELSVISGIALDHTDFLGDTVEKIAKEKAGIIKPACPIIFGGDDISAETAIKEAAFALESEYFSSDRSALKNIRYSVSGSIFDIGERKDIEISLAGVYQPINASLVIKAADILISKGYMITEETLRKGLKKAKWPARFEVLKKNDPVFIYDGGHNPDGVKACVNSIKKIFGNEKILILSGVMKDKSYREMIDLLTPICKKAFTVMPDNPRALNEKEYAEEFLAYGIPAQSFTCVSDGVSAAYSEAKKCKCPLLALGSLYMYAEIKKASDLIIEKDR